MMKRYDNLSWMAQYPYPSTLVTLLQQCVKGRGGIGMIGTMLYETWPVTLWKTMHLN